ncbi:MAG: hypothetical protein AB7T19_02380 [Planctomycetota bacterium]
MHTGSVCYDAARRECVLFGGVLDSSYTWVYRDGAFRGIVTADAPTGPIGVALGFDHARGVVIAFGGQWGGTNSRVDTNETWSWNGAAWTRLSPSNSPPARRSAALGFDPVSGKMILFGGYSNASLSWFSDTWEWDGSNWTQHFPSVTPRAREWADLVVDSALGELVLTGGGDWFAHGVVDQFVWRGGQWWYRSVPGSLGTRAAPDPLGRGLVTWDQLQVGLSTLPTGRRLAVRPAAYLEPQWSFFDPKQGEVVMLADDSFHESRLRFDVATSSFSEDIVDNFASSWDDWARVLSYDPQTQSIWCACRYRSRYGYGAAKLTNAGHLRIPFLSLVPDHANTSARMAFHSTRGEHCMLTTGALHRQELWWCDGVRWRPEPFVHGPAASQSSQYSRLFDDPRRGQLVFWSGDELWTWSGSSGWRQRFDGFTSGAPWPSATSCTLDVDRGVVVFVGGPHQTNQVADLWEFDLASDTMRQIPPSAGTPSGVYADYGTVTWAPSLGGTVYVAFVANAPTLVSRWDGMGWQALTAAGGPRWNLMGPLFAYWYPVYDFARRRIVAAGVSSADQFIELAPEELRLTPSNVAIGNPVRFDVTIPDRAHDLWVIGMALTSTTGVPFGPSPYVGSEVIPLDPDPMFFASIQSWMGGSLDSNGSGSFTLTIPNDPALDGLRLWTSAITIDGALMIRRATNIEELRVTR